MQRWIERNHVLGLGFVMSNSCSDMYQDAIMTGSCPPHAKKSLDNAFAPLQVFFAISMHTSPPPDIPAMSFLFSTTSPLY